MLASIWEDKPVISNTNQCLPKRRRLKKKNMESGVSREGEVGEATWQVATSRLARG